MSPPPVTTAAPARNASASDSGRLDPLCVDVAIVGGGLVGSSLALALSGLGLSLVLIESQPPPDGEGRWDERCIALNAGSRQTFVSLGLWSRIAEVAEPILATHISERGRFGVARFSAHEAGLAALGYNLPVRALAQALWAACQPIENLQLLAQDPVQAMTLNAEQVTLTTLSRTVQARLVVAADGARSALRDMLGIGAQRHDYAQTAIVSAVRPRRGHAGMAYERFLPDGPLALLPKPADAEGHACSLVWTLGRDEARERLTQSDTQFLQAAGEAFGERLGEFLTLGARSAYPLEQVLAERVCAPRVLLLGNAAQSLHPVAAQGFNLGLRDVEALAALLADRARQPGLDPGHPALLAAYAESRRRDRERVAGFTDTLVRLFSNRVPAFAQLRHLGLLALDLTPPVKQAVMLQNLGLGSGQRVLAQGFR